jgi:hypothetical protein
MRTRISWHRIAREEKWLLGIGYYPTDLPPSDEGVLITFGLGWWQLAITIPRSVIPLSAGAGPVLS